MESTQRWSGGPGRRDRRRVVGIGAVVVLAASWAGTGVASGADGPVVLPGAAAVVEGDAGATVLELPVTLSEPSAETVTVDYVTLFGPGVNPPAPAEPGLDFEAVSGTVTFVAGDTQESIAITVLGDTTAEPDEWIVVSFRNATNAGLGGGLHLGFGGILDDDPLIVPGAAAIAEGDAGTTVLELPVTLSEPSAETVTVDYVTLFGPGVNPPAPGVPGVDFEAVSGTVTFVAGDTQESIAITVLGDTTAEPDEWIVVSFRDAVGAELGGFLGLGFGGILDDDAPPVVPRLQPDTGRALEGDEGTTVVEVPVSLSSPTGVEVTVDWETVYHDIGDTAAVPGEDYEAASGTVTFAPGQTEATAPITVFGDTVAERDEVIALVFSNPVNAVFNGSLPTSLGFGYILDDDTPVPS